MGCLSHECKWLVMISYLGSFHVVRHTYANMCSSHTHNYIDSRPKIQRRHSLHSPTGEPRHPMKQVISMDSAFPHLRPQSMVFDYCSSNSDDDKTLAADLSSRMLQLPNGSMGRFRSHSNQNLASSAGLSPSSFVALSHTCGSLAPTNSPIQVTPATINSLLSLSPSGRPNLLKQLSQASSCAADSPSPVERDGPLSGGGTNQASKAVDSCPSNRNSVEVKYTTETDSSSSDTFPSGERLRTSPVHSKQNTRKEQQYLGAPLRTHLPVRSKPAPSHSHSNPEFPLTAHICMEQTERTHSYDDLYRKRRRPPCQAQAEDKVSPSREKINNLSCQIYSSLDQNWSPSLSSYMTGSYQHILKDGVFGAEPNPVCEVLQKIIKEVSRPPLNLSETHLQTLMEMSGACHHASIQQETTPVCSYSSLSSSEGETVHDSPVTHLRSLGYRLVQDPLTVRFGVPCDGYMTLTFKLITDKKSALLKVRTYVCTSHVAVTGRK